MRAYAVPAIGLAALVGSCTVTLEDPPVTTTVERAASVDTTSIEWLEADTVAMTNGDRQAIGVGPLTPADSLTVSARRQAHANAAAGALTHTDLPTLLGAWWQVAENVGTGPDTHVIQAAYRASPGHYANMMNGDYGWTGVGIAVDGAGTVWTVQQFAR